MEYIEYKGTRLHVQEGYTRDQVKDLMIGHFPELQNSDLVAKEDDPLGFTLVPKMGKKG